MKEVIETLGQVSGTRLLGYSVCCVIIILAFGLSIYIAARGVREKP